MEVIAGIDGGGTKTLLVLSDSVGRVLGVGRGGSSNIDDVGVEQSQHTIGEALKSACAEARLEVGAIASAFFGMAGVVSEEDRSIVRGIAERLGFGGAVDVDHDCRVALAGALSGRPGIVQIAGTGSSCFGRNEKGEVWRSGGWGPLISDEGSGFWLGREALVQVVRALDGRTGPTVLQERMLKAIGVNHPDRMLHRLYFEGISRSELAALAPVVIAAAQSGDQAAQNLLAEGTRLLVECMAAVAKQLNLPPDTELAVVGGLTRAGECFWQPLKSALAQRLPMIRLREAELPPVLGAIVAALEVKGKLSDAALQNLKQSAVQHRERW